MREIDELLHVANDLPHESEGIIFVVADRCVVLVHQPVVNFVFTHDSVAALILDLVVCHHKIAQETQRLAEAKPITMIREGDRVVANNYAQRSNFWQNSASEEGAAIFL